MRSVKVAAVIALLACGTACGKGPTNAAKPIEVAGTVTVVGSVDPIASDLTNCSNSGGYDDINQGAQVVVKNSDGKQVGVGKLSQGVRSGDYGCQFSFRVGGVASDASYAVTVANRAPFAFNRSDAKALALTIGG